MAMNINKEKFSDASIGQNLGKSGKAQVDLFNGNLTYVHTDVQFNYGNPVINVSHVYSSKAQSSGAYGNNWSLNCDEKIEIINNGGCIKYSDASGSTAYYYPLKEGVVKKANLLTANSREKYYVSPSNPTGGFIADIKSTTKWCKMYDEKGNFKFFENLSLNSSSDSYSGYLTKVQNTEGYTISYKRNTSGRVTRIYDGSGRYVNFTYVNEKLNSISDSAGRNKKYVYNNKGNLTEIYGMIGGSTRFEYNSDNCITEVVNEIGMSYKYTYDTEGRVKTVTRASSKDKISYDYESEENNKTYEVTTLSYDNSTSYKEELPTEQDQEVLRELAKTDVSTTYLSTNSGLYHVYHFKTENKLFYFNGMNYECDKIVYVTEGNTTYKMGIAKNTIHFKTSLNGESIDVQTCKNNLLRNAFFDNTQMDANTSYVTPEEWTISPLNNTMISYFSLDNTTALQIPDNGTEYTVSQEVVNTQETSPMGNTYNKLNSGLYTIVGWVKSSDDFVKRELSLQLVYGNNHVENVTLKDYEVVASINNWHCILRTVYVKDKKTFSGVEERLNSVIVKIVYKGAGTSSGMLVDRISFTAQQTSITESTAKLITMDNNSNVLNTYSIEDVDMVATRNANSGVTLPEDFKFTIPWFMNAVISYPQAENSSTFDFTTLNVVFSKDGVSETCRLSNIEVQLGAIVRKADSNYISESIMDSCNNPITQKFRNREKDSTVAFETSREFDNLFRETYGKDFRNLVTTTVYEDTLTNPTKTELTFFDGNESSGPWIRKISTYSSDKGGVIKEQGETSSYTSYVYNSGNGDADYELDRLYKVTYESGSYAKFTYYVDGNVATLVIGKRDVEHSYTYEYTYGLMTKVTTDSGDVFTYDYNGLGQIISIKQNGVEIVSHSYEYNYNIGFLPNKITTKFGKKYRTQFDAYGNPIEIYEYTSVNATTAADAVLKVRMVYDSKTHECVEIQDYTGSGSSKTPATVMTTSNDNNKVTFNSSGTTAYSYTKRFEKDLLKEEEKTVNDNTTYTTVEYDEDMEKGLYPDNRIMRAVVTNDSEGEEVLYEETFSYDNLGREESTTVKANDSSENTNTLYTKTNEYRKISNITGNLIQAQTVVIPNTQYGDITRKTIYKYDVLGNVIVATVPTNTNYPFETVAIDEVNSASTQNEAIDYTYDGNGKLIQESNKKADYSSIKYAYDTEGNITKKSVYRYATASPTVLKYEINYTYDSLGRLTGYGDKVIGNYDENGNPRLYKGSILLWNGARLSEMGGCGFMYDGRGYRTSKYVSATNSTHRYTYDEEGKLLSEKITDQFNLSTIINYVYGAQGVAGFKLIKSYYHNPHDYSFYYIKDILGNIRHIVDKNQQLVVSYYYDGWGQIYPQYHDYILSFAGETYTAEDISNLNGLFYKGYYYDKETKLYYLTTRYYDPEVGRFISPDDPQYLDFNVAYGYNRYAYCNNNPVMGYDPEGTFPWLLVAILVVATIALVGGTLVYGATSGNSVIIDGTVTIPTFIPFIHLRFGLSTVINFEKGICDFHFHTGVSFGYDGPAVSAGKINNYKNSEDIKGRSLSIGGGYYGGINYSPSIEEGGVSTVTSSVGYKLSLYVAFDNYF